MADAPAYVGKYPGAIPTLTDIPVGNDRVRSGLASGISKTATSLTVDDGSRFRDFGMVNIQDEACWYTTKTGNVLSGLTRGLSGSSAQSHIAGALVYQGFSVSANRQDVVTELLAALGELGANPSGGSATVAARLDTLVNTASNLGGVGLFAQKNVNDLEFKGLVAGANVTLTPSATGVTIASTAAGSGDVTGPAGATDNAVARYDEDTGKIIQNSLVTISDVGDIELVDGAKVIFDLDGSSDTWARKDAGANSWRLVVDGTRKILTGTTGLQVFSDVGSGPRLALSDNTLGASTRDDIRIEYNLGTSEGSIQTRNAADNALLSRIRFAGDQDEFEAGLGGAPVAGTAVAVYADGTIGMSFQESKRIYMDRDTTNNSYTFVSATEWDFYLKAQVKLALTSLGMSVYGDTGVGPTISMQQQNLSLGFQIKTEADSLLTSFRNRDNLGVTTARMQVAGEQAATEWGIGGAPVAGYMMAFAAAAGDYAIGLNNRARLDFNRGGTPSYIRSNNGQIEIYAENVLRAIFDDSGTVSIKVTGTNLEVLAPTASAASGMEVHESDAGAPTRRMRVGYDFSGDNGFFATVDSGGTHVNRFKCAGEQDATEFALGSNLSPLAGYTLNIEDSFILDTADWDDLRVPLSQNPGPAANAPTKVTYKTDGAGSAGVEAWSFGVVPNTRKDLFFTVQVPHDWKSGTDLKPHVHWSPTTVNAGNVVWELEYTLAEIDGTFGNTTVDPVAIAADGTTDKHQIDALSDVDMSGISSVSAVLQCRISRDAPAGGDTYPDAAILHEIDFHYQRDTLGSRTEFAK